ncbi:acyltransferase [Shigella flexneri]|nr:acyltransferase [Shigella flexneri]EHB6712942.1 acyltransferase [Shigella flexneri]EHD2065984.1 acyltransferase [Shigella flexneri]EHE8648028.1 acyltransferase [Shigella flexneri]EHE8709934.1 acyltransferase [Shigella flexneri]
MYNNKIDNNRKTRHDWVDALKFLGIFAIYLGYLGLGAGKLYPFVFSYHVPLFFFAAGFFTIKKNDLSIFDYIKSKFYRLMIPYFTFAFTILIINTINSGETIDYIYSHIYDIIYGVRNNQFVGTIWFINCLFVIIAIDAIFKEIVKNNIVILIISLLSFMLSQTVLNHNPLLDPQWFWNIDSAMAYWWLLPLGRCMFLELTRDRFFGKSKIGFIVFSITAIMSAYQLLNQKPLLFKIISIFNADIISSSYIQAINTIITTVGLIIFNIFIAKIICGNDFIVRAGRNTLNICGMEYITKLFIPMALAIIGFSVTIPNPICAIIYTCICVYVSDKIGHWLSRTVGGPFLIK